MIQSVVVPLTTRITISRTCVEQSERDLIHKIVPQVCVVVVVVTIILMTVRSNRDVRAIVRHPLPKGSVMEWHKRGAITHRRNGVNNLLMVVVPGIGTISRPHKHVVMPALVVTPTVFKRR